jgi:hypothetical protein
LIKSSVKAKEHAEPAFKKGHLCQIANKLA